MRKAWENIFKQSISLDERFLHLINIRLLFNISPAFFHSYFKMFVESPFACFTSSPFLNKNFKISQTVSAKEIFHYIKNTGVGIGVM